jgi:pimeloyl-ACP methyl ester carboxylesterase
MKIIKNFLLKGKHHKPIVTDVFYNKNGIRKPMVIFAHGYKGYKDWGCWNLIAETFAKQNIVFVKFNFSHNGGTPDQPIDFPDLQAFGYNNYTKELDDLQSVIDWVHSETEFKDEIDLSRITLIGHSRGGGIVILKSCEDRRISKVITWAGVADFESRFPKGDGLIKWKQEGVIFIENSRTKQQMPLYYQFYENFIDNKERLHIETAAKKLKIPHLIFHGTDDQAVSLEDAKKFNKWNPKSEFIPVINGNHTFGSKHPWKEESLPQQLQEIADNSIVFVNK